MQTHTRHYPDHRLHGHRPAGGHVLQQFASVKTVTIAGFSAGGQLVQRYVGLATASVRPVHRRYVVGSPSSWLCTLTPSIART